ncbi:MAG: class I SAM-dependent methyltransferase [Candidatus Omnitrophota bacterium]
MIKRYGKPVDIMRFKRSMMDRDRMNSIIAGNEKFGKFVVEGAGSEKISSCPICGSEDKGLGPVIYGIGYSICSSCGMYYANLRLAEGELKNYYTQDAGYSKTSYADVETYRYRAQEISSPKIDFVSELIKAPGRRWLDIGSGIGDVVYNLRSRGFHARGLELSEESIRFSKEMFGVDLENKGISDVLKEEGPGSFDVVSYFGVLEHMADPLKQVGYASELLSPGGLLVLEVPNAGSFSVIGDSFFTDSVVRQMTPFLHIMLFSQRSLTVLADKFGLKAEGMWFIGLDMYNLLLHLGVKVPGFLESEVCRRMLDLNNELQEIFDKKEMSDQILFVARKAA